MNFKKRCVTIWTGFIGTESDSAPSCCENGTVPLGRNAEGISQDLVYPSVRLEQLKKKTLSALVSRFQFRTP
jgi:hypothetical protein